MVTQRNERIRKPEVVWTGQDFRDDFQLVLIMVVVESRISPYDQLTKNVVISPSKNGETPNSMMNYFSCKLCWAAFEQKLELWKYIFVFRISMTAIQTIRNQLYVKWQNNVEEQVTQHNFTRCPVMTRAGCTWRIYSKVSHGYHFSTF